MDSVEGGGVPRVLTINGMVLDEDINLDLPELFPPEVLGARNQVNVKSWTCKHCLRIEKNISSYAKHLKTHYKVKGSCVEVFDSKKIECDICCKKFVRSFSLYRHLQKHTGEFTCSLCLTIYSRKSDLVNHQKNCKDGDETVLQCVICKHVLQSRKELREHLIMNHSKAPVVIDDESINQNNESLFPCSYCKKSYSRRFLLNNHVKTKHNIYGLNADEECLICHVKFNSSRTALRHRQIHEKGKTLKCLECDQYFLSESMLKQHKAKHESESYSCPYCDSVVRYSSSLKRHVQKVHKTKTELFDLDKYKCSLPLKKYKNNKQTTTMRSTNLRLIRSKDLDIEEFNNNAESNVLQDNFMYDDDNLLNLAIDYPIDIFGTDDMNQLSNNYLEVEPQCDFYVDTDTGQLISLEKML